MFQIFDYYAGSRIIVLIAFFECIVVAWVYGIRRFYDNMAMMLGRQIDPYMKISWTITSPIFCLVSNSFTGVYAIVLAPNFLPSHNYCDGNSSVQIVVMS